MEEKQKKEEPVVSKVQIEVVRYKRLFRVLEDPRLMWKVLLSFFLIVVVLFCGLSCVVIAVKTMYPYEKVNTNAYGATIIEDENKEVSYWLFNTAELWANSGIQVSRGDVLTIRSSGKMHTAVHHLVADVDSNVCLRDNWVGTECEDKISLRDRLRRVHRIAENKPENILLMQVLDPKDANHSVDFARSGEESILLGQGRTYLIGKERTEMIVAEKDGVLHFAVNDIVLTDHVVLAMCNAQTDYVLDSLARNFAYRGCRTQINDLKTAMKSFYNNYVSDSLDIKSMEAKADSIKMQVQNLDSAFRLQKGDSLKVIFKRDGLQLGEYPGGEDKWYPLYNELLYYKDKKFRDAWFVDNLGSFLIAIERKKHK